MNKLLKYGFVYSPSHPDNYDWSNLYPVLKTSEAKLKKVEFLDVGCGYGGLLGKSYFSIKKT